MEGWAVGQKRRAWFARSLKDRFLVGLYPANTFDRSPCLSRISNEEKFFMQSS